MEKRDIMIEAKAVQKAVVALKKKFEKERARVVKLDEKNDKKRHQLEKQLQETSDPKKREKLEAQINALPMYEDALCTVGDADDDFDASIIGALCAMESEIESIVGKDGFINRYFEELTSAEEAKKG